MPRKPRMYLPGIPAHVVQRGNNRQACFCSEDDYRFYLEILGQGLRRYGVALHAYVLMTNHAHLLMIPEYEDSVSRVMQHVGRLYVLHINRTYRRTGTLWEGRHKASLIDAERYLLACYRYIELNSVAAGMVARPDDYPWPSYRCHAWGEADPLVVDHKRGHKRGQDFVISYMKKEDTPDPGFSANTVPTIVYQWTSPLSSLMGHVNCKFMLFMEILWLRVPVYG